MIATMPAPVADAACAVGQANRARRRLIDIAVPRLSARSSRPCVRLLSESRISTVEWFRLTPDATSGVTTIAFGSKSATSGSRWTLAVTSSER